MEKEIEDTQASRLEFEGKRGWVGVVTSGGAFCLTPALVALMCHQGGTNRVHGGRSRHIFISFRWTVCRQKSLRRRDSNRGPLYRLKHNHCLMTSLLHPLFTVFLQNVHVGKAFKLCVLDVKRTIKSYPSSNQARPKRNIDFLHPNGDTFYEMCSKVKSKKVQKIANKTTRLFPTHKSPF